MDIFESLNVQLTGLQQFIRWQYIKLLHNMCALHIHDIPISTVALVRKVHRCRRTVLIYFHETFLQAFYLQFIGWLVSYGWLVYVFILQEY